MWTTSACLQQRSWRGTRWHLFAGAGNLFDLVGQPEQTHSAGESADGDVCGVCDWTAAVNLMPELLPTLQPGLLHCLYFTPPHSPYSPPPTPPTTRPPPPPRSMPSVWP
jgi:hypothetical protein